MSEIKCPVCQNNLHKINIVVSTCTNDKCKLWGSSIPNLVLEALARTRKALDIAVDALKLFDSGQYTSQPDSYGLKTDASRLARKTLNEITTTVEQKE